MRAGRQGQGVSEFVGSDALLVTPFHGTDMRQGMAMRFQIQCLNAVLEPVLDFRFAKRWRDARHWAQQGLLFWVADKWDRLGQAFQP
jgi:hypothetical protein